MAGPRSRPGCAEPDVAVGTHRLAPLLPAGEFSAQPVGMDSGVPGRADGADCFHSVRSDQNHAGSGDWRSPVLVGLCRRFSHPGFGSLYPPRGGCGAVYPNHVDRIAPVQLRSASGGSGHSAVPQAGPQPVGREPADSHRRPVWDRLVRSGAVLCQQRALAAVPVPGQTAGAALRSDTGDPICGGGLPALPAAAPAVGEPILAGTADQHPATIGVGAAHGTGLLDALRRSLQHCALPEDCGVRSAAGRPVAGLRTDIPVAGGPGGGAGEVDAGARGRTPGGWSWWRKASR